MSKKYKRNLLIVCEGANTEPAYFAILAQQAKEKGIWDSIEISPEPKLEIEEAANERSGNNKNRPKRQLTSVKIIVPDNAFLTYLQDKYGDKEGQALYENSYKAVPTRYVAEAEEKMADAMYEQAWAVYDKNGHPKHEEAWEMKNLVEIAFSSISFEYWVLLHFEKINQAFAKSAEVEESVRKNYLPNYTKRIPSNFSKSHQQLIANFKNNIDALLEKNDVALENAAWLRYKMQAQIAANLPYKLNPYTNVDELVKTLLGITKEIIWTGLGDFEIDKQNDISIDVNGNCISIAYQGLLNIRENNVLELFNLRDLNNENSYPLQLVTTSLQRNSSGNACKFQLTHQQNNSGNLVLQFNLSADKTLLVELF